MRWHVNTMHILTVLLVLCSSTLALAKKKRGETLWVPLGHGDKAHGDSKIRDKQRQAQRLKWAHKRAHKKNWTGLGKRNHSWAMGALPQARAVHLGGQRVQQAPNLELLRVGAEAVRLASLLCANAQQQLSSSEKVDKNDDSPVTVADYAAQAVVAWSLSRSPVACQGGRLSMVAEEDSVSLREPSGKAMLARITDLINGVITTADPTARVTPDDVINLIDLGTSAGGPTGRHWVLDPIDGTRGFVGMRQYSVCLGMLQDGVVELGLLGCPNLPKGLVSDDAGDDQSMARSLTGIDTIGALFLALRGYGSYVTDLTGAPDLSDLQPIHVHDLTDVSLARFMESYESRHSDHSFSAALAREMGVTAPPLRMDSQVKYGLLSRGAASIFMRFPPASYKEKIWDHCAGVVIVEEAGGRVTDAGGRRLDFSKGRYLELDRGIVAAPPNVHQEILRAISAVEAGGKSPR